MDALLTSAVCGLLIWNMAFSPGTVRSITKTVNGIMGGSSRFEIDPKTDVLTEQGELLMVDLDPDPYPPNKDREPLVYNVKYNKPPLWTSEQRKSVLSIDPDAKYKIPKLKLDKEGFPIPGKDGNPMVSTDRHGKPVIEKIIDGTEVRKSFAMMTAAAEEFQKNHGKLNAETRKSLCLVLYGHEGEPRNAEERAKRDQGIEAAQDAVLRFILAEQLKLNPANPEATPTPVRSKTSHGSLPAVSPRARLLRYGDPCSEEPHNKSGREWSQRAFSSTTCR